MVSRAGILRPSNTMEKRTMTVASVMIVARDVQAAQQLQLRFRDLGYRVAAVATSIEDAVRKAEELRPALVMMDVASQGKIAALEAAEQMQERTGIPVICLASGVDPAAPRRVGASWSPGYIVTPLTTETLRCTMDMALHNHRAHLGETDRDERHRALFDAVPVALYRSTPEGRFLAVNLASVALLGYPDRETLLATNALDTYAKPGDRERWTSAVDRDEVVLDFEAEFRRFDGTTGWLRNNARAIYDDDGRARYYEGSSLDITERKLAEEALRESEQAHEALFQTMMEGYAHHQIVLDDQGSPVDYVFLSVNRSFERLTGLRSEDIVGKRATEALPGIENDPADWIGVYGKVALGGERVSFEQYSEPLSRWYAVTAHSPARLQFVTLFHDITERKWAAEALQTSEERYRALFDEVPVGLYRTTPEGRVLNVNQATVKMLGYPNRETLLATNGVSIWAKPDDRKKWQSAMEREGVVYDFDAQNRRFDGTTIWVRDRSRAIRDDLDQVLYYEGSTLDITE